MTINKLFTLCTAAGWLSIAGCDFDKTLGSVGDDETGTTGDEDSGTATGMVCTEDARICPDGTAVGREGPDCEFAPCPGETGGDCPPDTMTCADGQVLVRHGSKCEFPACGDCPADAMLCPDGTSVGRQGPDCEFAPCPDVEPCAVEECGPAPGAPSGMCEDGTVSGPVCLRGPESLVCSWQIRECPVACPDDARLCADGRSVGRSGPDCAFDPCPGECEPEQCPGTPPPIANEICADGTVSGPFCMMYDDLGCGWEVRSCGEPCDGDAYVCPDGTVVGREGPNCEFAPCPEVCPADWVEAEPAACPSPDVPVLPEAGCYEPCIAEGDACALDHVCMEVQTHPCVCEGDETCCDACSATELLCVPEGTGSACAQLERRRFSSVEVHECGLSPDAAEPALCNWMVAFNDGRYEWAHSDVSETGTYACEDGTITTEVGLMGSYDLGRGILVWDGFEYAAL